MGNSAAKLGTLWQGLAASAGLWLLTASVISFILPAPWGISVGALLGAAMAGILWQHGAIIVPVNRRGLRVVLGARQQGAEHELDEGLHWVLPGFVKVATYDVLERSMQIDRISVETRDKNVVKADISVQWAPKNGDLFAFGSLELGECKAAFDREVRAVATAFGGSKETISDLTSTDAAQALSRVVLRHLQNRAAGQLVAFRAAPNGELVFDDFASGQVPSWGLDVRSVTVSDFELPQLVTDAATAHEVAAARRRAVPDSVGGMVEIVRGLREEGVDPHVALNFGQAILAPGAAAASSPVVLPGVPESLSAVAQGLVAAAGARQVSKQQELIVTPKVEREAEPVVTTKARARTKAPKPPAGRRGA